MSRGIQKPRRSQLSASTLSTRASLIRNPGNSRSLTATSSIPSTLSTHDPKIQQPSNSQSLTVTGKRKRLSADQSIVKEGQKYGDMRSFGLYDEKYDGRVTRSHTKRARLNKAISKHLKNKVPTSDIASTEGEPAAATSFKHEAKAFHLFPNLPSDIKKKIWSSALSDLNFSYNIHVDDYVYDKSSRKRETLRQKHTASPNLQPVREPDIKKLRMRNFLPELCFLSKDVYSCTVPIIMAYTSFTVESPKTTLMFSQFLEKLPGNSSTSTGFHLIRDLSFNYVPLAPMYSHDRRSKLVWRRKPDTFYPYADWWFVARCTGLTSLTVRFQWDHEEGTRSFNGVHKVKDAIEFMELHELQDLWVPRLRCLTMMDHIPSHNCQRFADPLEAANNARSHELGKWISARRPDVRVRMFGRTWGSTFLGGVKEKGVRFKAPAGPA